MTWSNHFFKLHFDCHFVIVANRFLYMVGLWQEIRGVFSVNKFFKSRMLRSMIPYFILGVGFIIAFRLISEISFFTDIIGRFFGIIAPFLMGAVIAYILNLPCTAIQRVLNKINNPFVQKRSRPLSVVSLFLIVVIIIIFLLNMVIPAVSRSIVTFVAEFDTYEQTFRDWMETVNSWDLPEFLPDIDEDALITVVQEFVQGLGTEDFVASIIAGFGSAALAVFHTIIAIIASIYYLLEKDRLKAFADRLIKAVSKERTSETITKYAKKLNYNFHQYIYTQTIDGIILGSIMTAVLGLGFRSPYALVLGLILGVVNYIPYFGSIFGTALAVVVVAFTQGLPTAAIAAIIMFIIQQIDGNVIQPKLMGGSFSLSPLLIIISVTVGGAYAGIMGMLVAIPIVAILKDLVDEYIAYCERKKLENTPPNENDFMNRDIW